MTLLDFISALKTKEIKVTLLNEDDNELIKFYSDGYTGVESDILAKTVRKWDITSQSAITVALKDTSDSSQSESETQSESEATSESHIEP